VRLRRASAKGRRCAACRHFAGRPDELERAIPGLKILSSGYGATPFGTGLCRLSDRLTAARSTCADFAAMADYR
jgi:hypothetical protein